MFGTREGRQTEVTSELVLNVVFLGEHAYSLGYEFKMLKKPFDWINSSDMPSCIEPVLDQINIDDQFCDCVLDAVRFIHYHELGEEALLIIEARLIPDSWILSSVEVPDAVLDFGEGKWIASEDHPAIAELLYELGSIEPSTIKCTVRDLISAADGMWRCTFEVRP